MNITVIIPKKQWYKYFLQMLIYIYLIKTTSISGQSYMELQENKLYENLQQLDQSFKYYKFNVSQKYIETGQEILVVKAISTSYLSDPDLFITKQNSYPTNTQNSEYSCQQYGSETCIIMQGEYQVKDQFVIGVKCIKKCQYNLKIYYTNILQLSDSTRQQIRFPEYSTQILQYYIPQNVNGLNTASIEILIEPENLYTPIDASFSFDQNLYIIEQKPLTQIIKNGVAIKLTQNDENWCFKCYIFVIINVQQDGRYFITANPISINNAFTSDIPLNKVLVNPSTQECYNYFVIDINTDIRFDIQGLSGLADIYVTPFVMPTSPNNNIIKFRASRGSSNTIIITKQDRLLINAQSGNYYICFFAYSPYSALVNVTEQSFGVNLDVKNNFIQSYVVQPNSFFYTRFLNTDFINQFGKIFINLESDFIDVIKFNLYYQVCTSRYLYCTFSSYQLNNTDKLIQNLTQLDYDISSNNKTINSTILHNPKQCTNQPDCVYMIYFDYKGTSQINTYLTIMSEVYNPGDVILNNEYQNLVSYGSYINYEINNKVNYNIQPYIQSLKIILKVIQGDADIFISYMDRNPKLQNSSQYSIGSQQINQIEIIEGNGENLLNRPIYFSVYGHTQSQFKIIFEYTFKISYNGLLSQALPVADGSYNLQNLIRDTDKILYQFTPWWSDSQNRTIVILADVILNKIQFQTEWNSYPQIQSANQAINNVVVYYGNDKKYHTQGIYYTDLKPRYGLFNLLSQRQYIFNFYQFSMTPASYIDQDYLDLENLQLGQDYLGYSNASTIQDYKFLQFDFQATYDIRLTRIPGYGQPIFYIKMMDSSKGKPGRPDNFHFNSQQNIQKPKSVQNLTLTYEMRNQIWPTCNQYFRSVQENGDDKCIITVSVTCSDQKMCAWKLIILQHGVNSSVLQNASSLEQFSPNQPPGTIFDNQFTLGKISFMKINYYFFPISYEDYGQILILLNKKQIYGVGENGDSYLIGNFQQNINDYDKGYSYLNWKYPTIENNSINSRSNLINTPEIVYPQKNLTNDQCSQNGCALIVGVVGLSQFQVSSYSLKAFRGKNKLLVNYPHQINISSPRDEQDSFDYYWFFIHETIANQQAKFEYIISVSSFDNVNPNLYVSVLDGREPNENNYDFASTMIGSDIISIRSNDSFWAVNGKNTSAGILVVVGVKVQAACNYTLLLTTPDYQVQNITRISLGQLVEVKLPKLQNEKSQRGFKQVYQLFNWQHKNIIASLSVTGGNVTMLYSRSGQLDYKNNIYSAIPISNNNSLKSIRAQNNKTESIYIYGSECFQCWHFFTILVEDPISTIFRMSVTQDNDNSGKFTDIYTSKSQIYIQTNSSAKRKFILDYKDNFLIYATVSTGKIEMFIGLNASTVGPNDYLWRTSSQGGFAQISVKTTDDLFQMATQYYLIINPVGKRDALINLNMSQLRTVSFIPNNYDFTFNLKQAKIFQNLQKMKFQFQNTQEQVKFHVFRLPGLQQNSTLLKQYFKVKINIEQITPYFYPRIYLKLLDLKSVPAQISQYQYPNINTYDLSFGEQPFAQINSNKFEYEFFSFSTKPWAFYTMAVYQYNWGMTSMRKSEYSIKVDIQKVNQCDVILCDDFGKPTNTTIVKS